MLKYHIEQVNQVRIITLEGQLSIQEKDILRNILEKEKKVKEFEYILEFSQVFYIDSFGISFIQKILLGDETKRKLVIVSDRDYIRYVLRFNKLDMMMNVSFAKNVDEALMIYDHANK
jgi:anti-anti-sigma factor